MNQNRSEVGRLMQQSEAEYEAAARGLTGLAYGGARQACITAKQETIATHVQQWRGQGGDQQACALLCELECSSREAGQKRANVEKGATR